MKFRPLLFACLGLAPVVLVAAVSAQTAKPAAKPPVAPLASENDRVSLHNAPDGTSIYDGNTHITQIDKDVTVSQKGQSVVLYAQHVIYDGNKDQARATGKLRIETHDSTIRGDYIFVDFNTKIATITGNVVVTTHGKTDGITGNRSDLRSQFNGKSSKIVCQRADWDYEQNQATLTLNIHMTQGQKSGTCDRILYDETKNVAKLEGSVRFTDENNNKFNTPNLVIYINEGRIITKGGGASFPRNGPSGTTSKTAKAPILTVEPPPSISNDALNQFGIVPPPIPTPRPEPTEVPVPTPLPDPEEAAPDAPAAPTAPASRR